MIDTNTIKACLQGVSYISQYENELEFHRFTKAEEAYYEGRDLPRHLSTSGIKLAFVTASTTLHLKVSVEFVTPTHYFSHDVFCNKRYVGSLRNFTESDLPLLPEGDYASGEFEGCFDLGEGEKEVVIYFPWSVKSVLKELRLDGSAYVKPSKPDSKMLVYGDSITYGASAAYPSSRPFSRLAEHLGVEEICKGIGGEIFCPSLIGTDAESNVKYITVAYGTNEIYSDFDDFKLRCEKFYEKLSYLYLDATVFALSPIWRGECKTAEGLEQIKRIEETIKNTAEKHKNAKFISGFDFVPNDEKLFADKTLHPNDEGFEHYYKKLKDKVDLCKKHAIDALFFEEMQDIYRLTIPFQSVYTSVFLIKTEDGYILIDCATTKEDVDGYIIPALEKYGISLSDVKKIVITHDHSDHAGGLPQILKRIPHIEVVKELTRLADGVCTYPLYGHTKDFVGVLDERSGTLISGDGLQGAGIKQYRTLLADKDAYVETLERIRLDERIENVLFSHEYEPWYKNKMLGRENVLACLEECKKYIK